jgi:hypothetical protein
MTLAESKPCFHCTQLISIAGISRVWYSTATGQIEMVKTVDLLANTVYKPTLSEMLGHVRIRISKPVEKPDPAAVAAVRAASKGSLSTSTASSPSPPPHPPPSRPNSNPCVSSTKKIHWKNYHKKTYNRK